jgi:hypothetical protein
MTPSTRVWIGTFVALVFLIGGMAGVVVDRMWLLPARVPLGLGPGGGSGRGGGGPGMQNPARIVADLDERLDLTADQEAAILQILEAWRPRVQEVQNSTRQRFVDMQRDLQTEIAKTLTADQAARFEKMGVPIGGPRGPRGGPGMGGRDGRGR